jgi:hypothetical protein
MKVRILSGNQTGAVVEMPVKEAEANIATGYAEAVIEEAPSVSEPEPEPEPPPRYRRSVKSEPDEE